MRCWICGSIGIKRLTPDLDVTGIPICDSKKCDTLTRTPLLLDPKEPNINRERKRQHKLRGNLKHYEP